MNLKQEKQAVVMGGSMAGLLAARVLADHFEQVTIIERDPAPENAPRKGVPQGQHVHGLLKSGEQVLAKLFPDFINELITAGSMPSDFAGDWCWFQGGYWKVRYNSGFRVVTQTRPFLEWKVQQRVAAYKNITFCYESSVNQLFTTPDKSRITGVQLQSGENINADLVVDTGGRGSRLPQWLEAMGYARPTELSVKIGLTYASILFERAPQIQRDWKAFFILPQAPQEKRGSLIVPVEDHRFMVSIMSYMDEAPPENEADFLRLIQQLYPADVYEELKNAQQHSELKVFRFPAQTRRHYEKLKAFPAGLVVMGDAVCSFDPLFGQGMSVAGKEAVALDDCLKNGLDGLAGRFHKKIAAIIDPPWMLTSSEAFRYPEAEGTKPPGMPVLQWYVARVLKRSAANQKVYSTFMSVMHLINSPAVLFHPMILGRVLFGGAVESKTLADRPPQP